MTRRVYVDTNFLVALIESGRSFPWLSSRATDGFLSILSSELTLSELLVFPYRHDDWAMIGIYEHMFRDPGLLEPVPVTRSILTHAARLRAVSGGKLPDAIHVASAEATQCSVFISSDRRLKMPAGLIRIAVEDCEKEALWPW